MTKTEYLEQLNYRLRVLPESERQDALDYYDGYLNDAENEAEAITGLGTPGEAAANILANYVSKNPRNEPGKPRGVKTAFAIILAVFALPVGLPIIITLAIIPIILFISLGSVLIAVGATGVSMLAAGLAGIITFPFVVAQDLGTALITGGSGLFALGIGILFFNLTIFLLRGFPMIARFVAAKITRRNRHGR